MSSLAGQTVTLTLATEAERPGTVALWGAPTLRGAQTLTGAGPPGRPNVIFYVIDGGAADFMSVYGYQRRTTATLERLAAEGAVFERAYSNASWTRPSTASFMTGLQNSVMGGLLGQAARTPVPEQAVTMAEHMHRAGYQTAFFSLHQGPYDETMAHNDHQLGRLVDRLKAEGAWENTLLIIGGDHSTRAAMDDMWIALSDTLPPRWGQPMFRPTISRVPLIVVWPGHIRGGQRFPRPVSMIDVLPTALDLVEKYTTFLEAQRKAHQALAQRFTRGEESPLTPEQLRTLRSLGYIT